MQLTTKAMHYPRGVESVSSEGDAGLALVTLRRGDVIFPSDLRRGDVIFPGDFCDGGVGSDLDVFLDRRPIVPVGNKQRVGDLSGS
jgi:hypothetical protein